MRKLILFLAGVLAMLSVVLQDRYYCIQAASLEFTQLSVEYDGTTTWTDSEWGCAHFDFTGQAQTMYLNVAVNGTWQVQNAIINSIDGVGIDQTLAVNFDLGVTRGTPVSSLQYAYSLTPTVLTYMPTGSQNAAVTSEWIRQWGGMDDGVMPTDLPSAHPFIGGPAADPQKHVNPRFPNQQCHENECTPAAVSNSLKFLNREKGLGLTEDQTSIASMLSASHTDGNSWIYAGWESTFWGQKYHNAWWQDKNTYMQSHGYNVTTRRIMPADFGQLVSEIDAHQDIELVYSWMTPDGKKGGHTVAVTEIDPLPNGKYDLWVVSDWDQANDTKGCYPIGFTFDPHTSLLDAGLVGVMLLDYAVVECPEPSIFALLSFGAIWLLTHAWRQRSQTA
jgi:hypothetical protein